MEAYQESINELAGKLTQKQTGKIKSVYGVMNLVYSLVEETIRRNKKKIMKEFNITPDFKRELTINAIKTVTQTLGDKKLISIDLTTNILSQIEDDKIDIFVEIIDDVMEIWLNDLLSKCGCLFNMKRNDLKKLS